MNERQTRLAAIRERDTDLPLPDKPTLPFQQAAADRRWLLAELDRAIAATADIEAEASRATLDAIEAGVRELTKGCLGFDPPYHGGCMKSCHVFDRDAVLALIEKQREG